jgi:hypothetical protein
MKSSELRIGNWVKIGKHQTTVSHIMGDEDFFEPIPLTPEILENAGFEKCSCGGWKGVVHIRRDDKGNLSCKDVQLSSVHQFQNLVFALTGDELEIDLNS